VVTTNYWAGGGGLDCGAVQWEGAMWIWRCCRRGVKPDGFYLSGHSKLWGCFHCSSGFLHESGLVTVDYCFVVLVLTFVAFIVLLPNFLM
jgi:hypothetical protein